MKNVKILHKRGVRAPVPDDLDVGEVAVNTAAGRLYVKTDGDDIVEIGGDGGSGGSAVTISETAPLGASVGDEWFCSKEGEEALYIFDGDVWFGIPVGGGGGDSKPEGYDETKAIASGVMTTGEMVVLNDDGTVSVVAGENGPPIDTNLTDSNYIGVSKGDYADGSVATVQIAGINADQQGMTQGKQYILPDGSLTTDESSGGGGDYEVWTPEVFTSTNAQFISSTYDPVANKVVISYADGGNSFYATAVVGTVSGNSITFGTPVVFNSKRSDSISSTYDPVNNKVVISYEDAGNSYYGTTAVGTVSGDSISFGTPVVFNTETTEYISSTYDSVNNKVVISYRDRGNNGFGTTIVGTVSEDSISFGTPVVFNSGQIYYTSSTYDSANNKVVIAYRDSGNYNYGTAIVGTVSGDSITFGSPVVFNSNGSTNSISSTYDSVSNKVVIAYKDSGNDNYGTAIVGTVSGYSISFGTPTVFNSETTSETSSTYDPVANKVVISYRDGGDDYGTVIAGTVSGNSISFDAPEVFNTGYTSYTSTTYNSANKKVVISYQDQGNSSYGTAVTYGADAGEPNVFAGTAISSTELNIKDTV